MRKLELTYFCQTPDPEKPGGDIILHLADSQGQHYMIWVGDPYGEGFEATLNERHIFYDPEIEVGENGTLIIKGFDDSDVQPPLTVGKPEIRTLREPGATDHICDNCGRLVENFNPADPRCPDCGAVVPVQGGGVSS